MADQVTEKPFVLLHSPFRFRVANVARYGLQEAYIFDRFNNTVAVTAGNYGKAAELAQAIADALNRDCAQNEETHE